MKQPPSAARSLTLFDKFNAIMHTPIKAFAELQTLRRKTEKSDAQATCGVIRRRVLTAEKSHITTVSSLLMLARFSSREECTYLSSVTVVLE